MMIRITDSAMAQPYPALSGFGPRQSESAPDFYEVLHDSVRNPELTSRCSCAITVLIVLVHLKMRCRYREILLPGRERRDAE